MESVLKACDVVCGHKKNRNALQHVVVEQWGKG